MLNFIITVIIKTRRMNLVDFGSVLGRVLRETFPATLIFGISLGLSLAFEFLLALKVVGAEALTSNFVTISTLKEIGPMISGSTVLIRSGTRITSEISSMKDRGILTAMEVFPLDSFSFVLIPRFWAIVFATVIFLPLANIICILSSSILATVVYGISEGAFWEGVKISGSVKDLLAGIAKCFIIGISNSIFTTYYGWSAKEGAQGVSEAIRKSVSWAFVLAIVINYLLSIIFFG